MAKRVRIVAFAVVCVVAPFVASPAYAGGGDECGKGATKLGPASEAGMTLCEKVSDGTRFIVPAP